MSNVICAGIQPPSRIRVLPGSTTENTNQFKCTQDKQTPEPCKQHDHQLKPPETSNLTPETSNLTCLLSPLRDITGSTLSDTPLGKKIKTRKKFIPPRPQIMGHLSATEATKFDLKTVPPKKVEVFCYEVLYHKYTRAKKKKYFDGILLLRTGKKTVRHYVYTIMQ